MNAHVALRNHHRLLAERDSGGRNFSHAAWLCRHRRSVANQAGLRDYPGERFYDGQLVAIEDSRLVFRREIVYSDGRRESLGGNETAAKVNTVDASSARRAKAAAPEAPAPEPEKKSEKRLQTNLSSSVSSRAFLAIRNPFHSQ